jgi:tetratricopeptide (TPR) repeat protein
MEAAVHGIDRVHGDYPDKFAIGIARVLVALGKFDAAVAAAGEVEAARLVAEEWARLCVALAEADKPDRAAELYHKIEGSEAGGLALAAIVRAYRKRGQHLRAEEAYSALLDSPTCARGLASLAETDSMGQARRHVALALKTGAWAQVLPAVARIDLAAANATVDECIRLWLGDTP